MVTGAIVYDPTESRISNKWKLPLGSRCIGDARLATMVITEKIVGHNFNAAPTLSEFDNVSTVSTATRYWSGCIIRRIPDRMAPIS